MNLNIDHYLKKYDGLLSNNECDQIVKEIEKETWIKHSFYSSSDKNSQSYSYDFDNLFDEEMRLESSKILNRRIYRCFHQYISDLKNPFFTTLNRSSKVRYNCYSEGTAMKPHIDHIFTLYMDNDQQEVNGIPILSMVGALNDDYEGGEFVMWQERIIPIPKGSVIIFPSNFLYSHHVEFVKKGKRHSFVSWAS